MSTNNNPQHDINHTPVQIITVPSSGDTAATNTPVNVVPEYGTIPGVEAGSNLVDNAEVGTFYTTGMQPDDVRVQIAALIDHVTSAELKFSISNGLEMMTELANAKDDCTKYPVICLINGVGGVGKDTFVEMVNKIVSVYNMSSIDPVKAAADVLIEHATVADHYAQVRADKQREEKTDAYRTFLHDIKTAWVKFCDGPTVTMMDKLGKLITTQLNGGEHYDIVFMHIREPEELEKTRERIIRELGLMCMTILVKGWIDPNSFENDGDRSVDNFDYDFVINNHFGDMSIFELQATYFAKLVENGNRMFGIPIDQEVTEVSSMPAQCIDAGAIGAVATSTTHQAFDASSNNTHTSNKNLEGTAATSPEFI